MRWVRIVDIKKDSSDKPHTVLQESLTRSLPVAGLSYRLQPIARTRFAG